MTKLCRVLFLVAILLATVLSVGLPAQQKKDGKDQAGLISEVKGTCWIKRGNETEQQVTLGKLGLLTGDEVRCDKKSSLLLELRGMRTTIEPSAKDDWTTIRRMSVMREDGLASPIDAWFETAAALRNVTGAIYSPPGGGYGSAVWPQRFVMRWNPPKGAQSVWLNIIDDSGKQLWPVDRREGMTVPAAQGELTSEEARHALLEYRKNRGGGPLVLVLVDSKGREYKSEFLLITDHDEQILTTQLQACGNSGGLMQFICRAYYYHQLKLFTEAAEEYDSALKIASDSIDLQLHAIVAHRFTGDYVREQALIRELPPGTKPPE